MKRALLWLSVVSCCAMGPVPAAAEGIVQVLARSQQMRLDVLRAAVVDGARAETVRASFKKVLDNAGVDVQVDLLVVRGPVWAETLNGRTIVVHEALGDRSEGERLFVLAHELGHVVQGHWREVGALYLEHVPGEVVQEATDAVAGTLGRAASAQSHRHEFDADAFALRLIRRLGFDVDAAISVFQFAHAQMDTATHPGTRKRVAHLRLLP
jgi:Zn-dependent protease with chaperone function